MIDFIEYKLRQFNKQQHDFDKMIKAGIIGMLSTLIITSLCIGALICLTR